MSSYGNHVWTPQLDLIVQRLVLAAMNGYDDEFAEILHSIAGINVGWPFGDDAPPMNCPNTAAARRWPRADNSSTRCHQQRPLGCVVAGQVQHRTRPRERKPAQPMRAKALAAIVEFERTQQHRGSRPTR
jgi:hypothetical protein